MLPTLISITNGKPHDVAAGRALILPTGWVALTSWVCFGVYLRGWGQLPTVSVDNFVGKPVKTGIDGGISRF